VTGVVVDRDVVVPMRDGTRLVADVYRPADNNRHPVLVHRMRISKSSGGPVFGGMVNPVEAASRGYATMIQEIRGRGKSEGEAHPFRFDVDDGYDTVEWAAEQPWSDGRVGVYGSSGMGITAWQAVIAAPPHLSAAAIYSSASNFHEGWAYTGGALELGWTLWWNISAVTSLLTRDSLPDDVRARIEQLARRFATDPNALVRHTPLRTTLDGLSETWDEWLDHPAYDAYWKAIDINVHADRVTVPVLQMAAWGDIFLKGQLDAYQSILHKAPEPARSEQRLLIGPWDHEAYLGMAPSKNGDLEFGSDAISTAIVTTETLQWFDRWLRGINENDPPKVRYFVTGSNRWTSASQWPPPHNDLIYYLHSAGHANTAAGDGRLSLEPALAEPADTFAYDPADPVPTQGGRSMMLTFGRGGVRDQSKVEQRPDVLCYTSDPFEAPVDVIGPARLVLIAASSAVDTDFVAKLIDVYPDGYAANMAEGVIRARYRNSREVDELLVPDKPTELVIDLWGLAHTFLYGHRVRLEISSSNFPRFDRNLNVASQPCDAALGDAVIATQSVYHDAAHPSRLILARPAS
jgi:putative CocE/NonD family hydrolase